MDVLQDDSNCVSHIIAGIGEVKTENGLGDSNGPVNVKVLWNTGDSQLSTFEVINDGVPESKSDLGSEEMQEGDNEMMTSDRDLSQHGSEEGEMLQDDLQEGHMLHVPDPEASMMSATSTIHVTTSLAGNSQDVLHLLPHESDGDKSDTLQTLNISLGGSQDSVTSDVDTQPTQTVQAITLADGTTAFIQHPNAKLLEGQTITLEDGSTAVVQGLHSKMNLVASLPTCSGIKTETSDGQAMQSVHLEDGSSFLNQAVKDGLQAIILEDGTTAYLATQNTGFIENAQLEATTLTLDQLTNSMGGVQALLPGNFINVHTKAQNDVSQGTVLTTSQPVDMPPSFGEKAYKCSYDNCGRFYTTLHHLRVHERSHTGDRPFRCDFNGCGKAFATGYGLKSHLRVHTGEKPYKCPEEACDKAFKTSGDLQKHVRTHTGERPFRCPFEGCKRSFTTSNIRKVHIRTHTGERPYTCPEKGCARAFASATNYKNHIRIHTGEKPYVCTVQGCGKRFTEYSSLYKHHVVHTHAKPYTCNRCGKTYRQTSTLAMHKRTTHGEDVTAESEALLFQEQSQAVTVEGLEPPDKQTRFFTLSNDDNNEEGEGTLIINTSDATSQLTLVGTDGLTATSDILHTSPLGTSNLLQHHPGVATFTLTDQSRQVYVITDPTQLEALQQIAQHQFEADTLDSSLITSLSSGEVVSLGSTDVTTVTEINGSDLMDTNVINISNASVTDIENS